MNRKFAQVAVLVAACALCLLAGLPNRFGTASAATCVPRENAGPLVDLPHPRGNLALTGEMPGPGPDPMGDLQVCKLFDNTGFFKTEYGSESTPAIVNGVAYFGSYDNYFYAVDVATGHRVWKFETGDWIVSSPVVDQGIVYFGSTDDSVYALQISTGELVWSYQTDFGVSGDATVYQGVVYIGSDDSHLYALNAQTGALVWKHETGCQLWNAPAIADGVLYLAERSLKALDPSNGSVIWNKQMGSGFCFSSPVVRDGMLYVGGYDGVMSAIDVATQAVIWEFRTRPSSSEGLPHSRIDSSAAVTDAGVFFGATDGYLYALHPASGQLLWDFQMERDPYYLSDLASPAVADDVVYMGTPWGIVFAVDAGSGELFWEFETDRYLRSSPVVLNGVVYVTARDGNFYAFAT